MAKKKKKKKAKPATRKPARKQGKKKAAAPKKKKKGAGRKASAGSEVERRWSEYWRCRASLEGAVAAVTEAQTALSSALDEERSARSVFDEAKESLKDLLEVEAPSRRLPDPPPSPHRSEGQGQRG